MKFHKAALQNLSGETEIYYEKFIRNTGSEG
jgi:hypothetical protein